MLAEKHLNTKSLIELYLQIDIYIGVKLKNQSYVSSVIVI